jgi:hypothetical protein
MAEKLADDLSGVIHELVIEEVKAAVKTIRPLPGPQGPQGPAGRDADPTEMKKSIKEHVSKSIAFGGGGVGLPPGTGKGQSLINLGNPNTVTSATWIYAEGVLAAGFGVKAGTAADAVNNTASLRAAIAACVSNEIAMLYLPAGDIYLDNTTPIDLTEVYKYTAPFDSTTFVTRAQGISIIGQGMFSTRLRTTKQGTLFRVYPTDSTTLEDQWFENLSILGLGISPTSKLSITVNSGSAAVTIADTTGLSTGMWVQDTHNFRFPVNTAILSIVGTTVTMTQNATGSGTSDLLFYTDSCAVQRGGVTASRSDVMVGGGLRATWIEGFFTGVRCDDCSGTVFDQALSAGCMYSYELWYNPNGIVWQGGAVHGIRQIGGSTGTCTNGSASITGVTFTKAGITCLDIPIGSKIADWTSSGFAPDVCVLSTTSTTITASATYTGGNGVKTMTYHKGIGVAVCTGPWRPAFNSGFGSPLNLLATNAFFAGFGAELWADARADGVRNLKFYNSYTESLYQLVKVGSPNGSGICKVIVEGSHFSTIDSAQSIGWIEGVTTTGTPGFDVEIKNNTNNGTMNKPFFYSQNASMGSARLLIGPNTFIISATQNTVGDPTFPQMSPYQVTNGSVFGFGMGPQYSGAVISQSLSGSTAQFIPRGTGTFLWTLTGNTTLGVFAANTFAYLASGQVLTIELVQDGTGGRSFTFPAQFVNSDGTTRVGTAGVIASGTANQRLVITFICNQRQQLFIRTDGNGVAWS